MRSVSDPMLPLNCPHCGVPLAYVSTFDIGHMYVCRLHGEFCLHLRHGLTGGNLASPALLTCPPTSRFEAKSLSDMPAQNLRPITTAKPVS